MTCNKAGYSSKKAAVKDSKIILADMKRYRSQKPGAHGLRPYECRYCGKWHLTSQRFHSKGIKKRIKNNSNKGGHQQ